MSNEYTVYMINLTLTTSVSTDILLDDVRDGTCHKDGCSVKIMVCVNKGYGRTKVCFFFIYQLGWFSCVDSKLQCRGHSEGSVHFYENIIIMN